MVAAYLASRNGVTRVIAAWWRRNGESVSAVSIRRNGESGVAISEAK